MDIRQLRHFLAVADARSFTLAARAIHISQPALSQSILRLEHELGCALFVRNKQNPGAGLIRTPGGDCLYADASEIIESVERATARARRAGHGQVRSRVAVGFTSATPRSFANAALKLSEAAAGVEVLPVHLTWGDEHTALRTGRVDLAFMQYPAGTTFPSYFAAEVARVPRVALFHAAHRLAERASVSLADIADEPILDPGFGDDPAMHRGYWLGEPHAHGPVVGPPVRTVEEMCLFVAAQRGMAITAGTIAEQYGRSDVAFVPIQGLDPVELGLVRLRTDARPAVLAVFENLADVPH